MADNKLRFHDEIDPLTGQVRLRVTPGTIVTEEKSEFLGLPGALIFLPFFIFVLVIATTGNFLVACLSTGIIYAIVRIWLRRKPSYFLGLWMWHQVAPRIYRHRFHDLEQEGRWAGNGQR